MSWAPFVFTSSLWNTLRMLMSAIGWMDASNSSMASVAPVSMASAISGNISMKRRVPKDS